MKKLSIVTLTLTAAIGIGGNTVLPVQAASINDIQEQLRKNGYAVIGGSADCLGDVNDILSEVCKELNNLYGCPNLTLPDNTDTPETDKEQPGTDNQPETNQPETDTNQPETDTNQPETGNQPGTDNQPETSQPETDTNKPGTDTNTPETDTNQPENNKPGTDKEELSFAEQVVALVNEERAKAGLNALTLDKEIEAAALVRANEIEISFAHTRPDGRSFSTALKDRGITYKSAGENIAWGQRSPEAVMEAWMNSDGHRANILNPRFTKIGVGYYQNTAGRNYWTQLFTY